MNVQFLSSAVQINEEIWLSENAKPVYFLNYSMLDSEILDSEILDSEEAFSAKKIVIKEFKRGSVFFLLNF